MTRRGGFTLVETIFSTLFIGVAVLAIVNLFPGAYLSIRRSETQLQADFVAKSVIDELRLVPMSQLVEGYEPPAEAPFDPWVVEGVTYTPKVEIYKVMTPQYSENPDFDFLKGVRVTVTYRIGLTEKSLVHETYLHQLIR